MPGFTSENSIGEHFMAEHPSVLSFVECAGSSKNTLMPTTTSTISEMKNFFIGVC